MPRRPPVRNSTNAVWIGADVSIEAVELGSAVMRFQGRIGRPATWAEVLRIAVEELGYRKVERPRKPKKAASR